MVGSTPTGGILCPNLSSIQWWFTSIHSTAQLDMSTKKQLLVWSVGAELLRLWGHRKLVSKQFRDLAPDSTSLSEHLALVLRDLVGFDLPGGWPNEPVIAVAIPCRESSIKVVKVHGTPEMEEMVYQMCIGSVPNFRHPKLGCLWNLSA